MQINGMMVLIEAMRTEKMHDHKNNIDSTFQLEAYSCYSWHLYPFIGNEGISCAVIM